MHILTIDGVYATPAVEGLAPCLHTICGPSNKDVGTTVEKIARRSVKLLRRRGYLDSEAEFIMGPDADEMFLGPPI